RSLARGVVVESPMDRPPTRATSLNETNSRRRSRQDAARLRLSPHRADRTEFRRGLRAGAHAKGDAGAWRLRRQVHHRLSQGFSGVGVHAREALRRTARSRAQLLRRERLPAALGVAKEGLDPSRRPTGLVPVVLPLLHGTSLARRRATDQTLARDASTRC